MSKLKLGRRYRLNHQGNKADGRVGTLEAVKDGEAWLKVAGFPLVRASVESLTDRGVVNADLTAFLVRRDPAPLNWGDTEAFA